jgi:acyl dehydratase
MSDDKRLPMKAENLNEGIRLGPLFYVVEADQVKRFTAVMCDQNPIFDPERSGADTLAPPTMRLADYALLIASQFKGGKGGVHAKHWCEFHEPIRVGQTVRLEGTITATYIKRGKFYFTLEYEQRDAVSGDLLTRQAITSVLLNEKGEMR